jgi:hypothetical protein
MSPTPQAVAAGTRDIRLTLANGMDYSRKITRDWKLRTPFRKKEKRCDDTINAQWLKRFASDRQLY